MIEVQASDDGLFVLLVNKMEVARHEDLDEMADLAEALAYAAMLPYPQAIKRIEEFIRPDKSQEWYLFVADRGTC